ncbi:malate dehydrogenase [Gracilaria domingensis]|nr:malate dehydrogenase [Gracilaria domingensis]
MPSVVSAPGSLRTKLSSLAKRLSGEDAIALNQLLEQWDQGKLSSPKDDVPSATTKAADSAPVVRYAKVEMSFLRQFMEDALIAAGVPSNEASVAAEVLEWADLHAVTTHGIGRLKPIYIDRINNGILKPTAPFEIVNQTETTAVVDGHGGLGLFIGPKCMDMCLEKAKKHGLAMVVVRNSTHYGAAGYYVDKAQQQGCIGITGTNARPSIAPTFGVQPMLGTNPMTFGMPSDDGFPFVLDCATSVNQRGKIEKYEREGKPTPPGQVVDRDGNVRTDTAQILKDLQTGYCSLAPLGGVGAEMGGYKGKLERMLLYNAVRQLTSPLYIHAIGDAKQDTDMLPCGVNKETGEKIPMPLGHFFIAIDVERFLPLEAFKSNVGKFLREMRASEKDPKGPGRIYTAGELEHEGVLDCEKAGGIQIPGPLMKDMIAIRELYSSIMHKYPKFSFEE